MANGEGMALPTEMRARSGQAMSELIVGIFALVVLVSAFIVFGEYIVKSLRLQGELRRGGVKAETVKAGDFAARYIIGSKSLRIEEKWNPPQEVITK